MKVQSVKKYAVSALLLPAVGLMIAHSVSKIRPAFADTLLSSTSTLAQDAPAQAPAQKKEWGNRGEKMFQQLGLSADQQAQIKSIMEQSKTSNQGLRQQVKTAREQLEKLMTSGDTSDDAIRQAHQQLQPLMQQMGDQWFDTMLKIRNVLTPAQRTKFAELHKQGEEHGKWGHHDRKAPAANGGAS